jgi:hypothetical protein
MTGIILLLAALFTVLFVGGMTKGAVLRRLAIIFALFASACHAAKERTDPWGRELDTALAPVLDSKARTVRELLAAGFVVVGQREIACDAGPGIACDGFDAVYLGKEIGIDRNAPAEFACPGSQVPYEDWKCRELHPAYVPNGGFKPRIANES